MSTRLLYLLAILLTSISVLFYVFNREEVKQSVATHPDIDSSATLIAGIQTNDQGLVQNTFNADALRHYWQDGRMELDRVSSLLYKQGVPQSKLSADRVVSLKNNGKVTLSGHVHVQQLESDPNHSSHLYTTILYGYPKDKRIETDQPVTIKSAQSRLVSQGVRADLMTGQYEFFKPRGVYAAAPQR
jgi:lipopolysaccharide export system protein LptC